MSDAESQAEPTSAGDPPSGGEGEAEQAALAEAPMAPLLPFEEIVRRVREVFPECEAEVLGPKGGGDPHLLVPVERIWEVCDFLRNDEDLYFDSLMSQAGVDDGKHLHVVYALHSMPRESGGRRLGDHKLLVKTTVERKSPPEDSPHVPTVDALWKSANFFEREIYDLFGIVFDNHPDLRRIMNPDDWVGHPGRKDYVYPAYYGVDNEGHGIPTEREGQFIDNYAIEDQEAGLAKTKDAKDGPVREWDLIRDGKLTKEDAAQRAAMGEVRIYRDERKGPRADEPLQLKAGITKKKGEKK